MASPQYRGPWTTLRLRILERDNYECQMRTPVCTHKATQVDHIQPIARGGAWLDPSNLRAACASCNRGWNRRGLAPSRNW